MFKRTIAYVTKIVPSECHPSTMERRKYCHLSAINDVIVKQLHHLIAIGIVTEDVKKHCPSAIAQLVYIARMSLHKSMTFITPAINVSNIWISDVHLSEAFEAIRTPLWW